MVKGPTGQFLYRGQPVPTCRGLVRQLTEASRSRTPHSFVGYILTRGWRIALDVCDPTVLLRPAYLQR